MTDFDGYNDHDLLVEIAMSLRSIDARLDYTDPRHATGEAMTDNEFEVLKGIVKTLETIVDRVNDIDAKLMREDSNRTTREALAAPAPVAAFKAACSSCDWTDTRDTHQDAMDELFGHCKVVHQILDAHGSVGLVSR